jgi:hypothetical protein
VDGQINLPVLAREDLPDLPVASRQKKLLTKKNGKICPRAKKKDSHFVPPGNLLGIWDFIQQLKKTFRKMFVPIWTFLHGKNNVQKFSWTFFAFFLGVFDSNLCAPAAPPPPQRNQFLNMDSSPYSSAVSPSLEGCSPSVLTVKVSILSCFSFDGLFDSGKYKLYAAACSSCSRRSILPRRGVGVGSSLGVTVAAWRQRGGHRGGSVAVVAAFPQLGGGGRSAVAAAAVAAAWWRW